MTFPFPLWGSGNWVAIGKFCGHTNSYQNEPTNNHCYHQP